MRILADVDGVFADFVGSLCKRLAERGFTPRTADDIKHWELSASLSNQETKAVYQIMAEPGFAASLEWYEGAKSFLEELKLLGDVFAVTSPFDKSETWERERKAWLEEHLPRKRVLPISGEYKHLVSGDILIEDHPGTAARWCEANPQGWAFLIDRPWNQETAKEYAFHRRMIRVKNYVDILFIIRATEFAGAA